MKQTIASNVPHPCACTARGASTPDQTVPRAAFERLRRQVNELAEVVEELVKSQPGADAPLDAPRLRGAREISTRTEPAALATRVARIVGGQRIPASELPHCAVLGEHLTNGGFNLFEWFCSGVLIRPRVILTAAHCMPSPPNIVALSAEDINRLQGAELVRVKKSFVHPGYRAGASIPNHDIAVLILEKDARTSPVAAATTKELAAATRTTLAGFGNDDVHSTRGFGLKRKVTVDIIALRRKASENFDSQESELGFESDDEFVAGNPVMDSCNGDSGGPAYILNNGKLLVAGLTSRGIREEPGDPTPCGDGGVYTRIDQHWDWIKQVAGAHLGEK
jgi:secreted trypsin-like serine protease